MEHVFAYNAIKSIFMQRVKVIWSFGMDISSASHGTEVNRLKPVLKGFAWALNSSNIDF